MDAYIAQNRREEKEQVDQPTEENKENQVEEKVADPEDIAVN